MFRKTLIFIFLTLTVLASSAQTDVTKFLGFPVDGSKTEMIKNLQTKGFEYSKTNDVLSGQFNGKNVNIYLGTNNNKLCRVMVCDANTTSETDIKIQFNNLFNQFKNNGKYFALQDYTIPEDDDISYEMSVNNKRYQAAFYQLPQGKDLEAIKEKVNIYIKSKYSRDDIENPSEEIAKQINEDSALIFLEAVQKKSVWFMIDQGTYSNQYYISIFYDNEYNRAQGEDL